METICNELYNKHKSGDFTKIMTGYLLKINDKINKEYYRKPNYQKLMKEVLNIQFV